MAIAREFDLMSHWNKCASSITHCNLQCCSLPLPQLESEPCLKHLTQQMLASEPPGVSLTRRLALDATILAEPSWFEWIVYGAQWLPFPMTHADLVIHARWTDLADVCPVAHDPSTRG